jgi:hypothetical protein
MTIVWRIAPDRNIHERVQEIAKKEMRSVSNTLKALVSEALFARQLAEGKQPATRNSDHAVLVAAIRGRDAEAT